MNSPVEVAGVGAYFEFVGPFVDYQLLLLPEGYTESMKKVSASAFYRSGSADTRSRWRSNPLPLSTVDFSSSDTIPLFFLTRVVRGSFKTLKGPFLFELCAEDYTYLEKNWLRKIPPRIVTRIKKVRASEDFQSSVKELPGRV
jgi:hypothetical protein